MEWFVYLTDGSAKASILARKPNQLVAGDVNFIHGAHFQCFMHPFGRVNGNLTLITFELATQFKLGNKAYTFAHANRTKNIRVPFSLLFR